MTTSQKASDSINSIPREVIIDQLRSCKTNTDILRFEKLFNSKSNSAPLYEIICELLKNRSISRCLAAKCLRAIINDRESRLYP